MLDLATSNTGTVVDITMGASASEKPWPLEAAGYPAAGASLTSNCQCVLLHPSTARRSHKCQHRKTIPKKWAAL